MTFFQKNQVSRIEMVKPERAREIENDILQKVQMGALQKVDEPLLIQMIEARTQAKGNTKIIVHPIFFFCSFCSFLLIFL